MKRLLLLAFSLLLVASVGAAAERSRRVDIRKGAQPARYRIELTTGQSILSRDAPVQYGSVLVFHRYPDGTLTGVPEEAVAGVRTGAADTATIESDALDVVSRPLQPGDILVLGPTGEGSAATANTAAAAGASGAPATPAVPSPYPGMFGYGGNPNTRIGSTGLPSAASSTAGQTAIGSNGFPATASPTTIGPNGTPTLSPGVPGSNTPLIGPNGTPVMAPQAGAPVPGGQQPIGPNGTPVIAPQSGAPVPGGQQPIGPNGMPVIAPPGAPGAAQPVIGPNGTPATPPR